MSFNQNSETLTIKSFTYAKQTKLFLSLKERKVSGQITFNNPAYQKQWHLYLYLGKLVYCTGGIHPIRRWQRNITVNLSSINFQKSVLQEKVYSEQLDLNDSTWEYEQLFAWIEQQKISLQQAQNSIKYVLQEVLFDLTLATQLNCHINQNIILYPKLPVLDLEETINLNKINENYRESGKSLGLLEHYTDLAPTILQPEKISTNALASIEPKLKQLLSENKSIKDLALELNLTIEQFVNFLLPYFQRQVIGLIKVPDLIESKKTASCDRVTFKRPLIACIDDSIMVSQMLEQLIKNAGYSSIVINDPSQALPTLITYKPDLILLDIVMPKINGYQLYSQLRQSSKFAKIPIIFLTSNNSLIDRVKARMIGATDFINKTIDIKQLLQTINQYLP